MVIGEGMRIDGTFQAGRSILSWRASLLLEKRFILSAIGRVFSIDLFNENEARFVASCMLASIELDGPIMAKIDFSDGIENLLVEGEMPLKMGKMLLLRRSNGLH